MVTREEFGQLVAEFESLRDMTIEEIGKLQTQIEELQDTVNEIARQTRVDVSKKIG